MAVVGQVKGSVVRAEVTAGRAKVSKARLQGGRHVHKQGRARAAIRTNRNPAYIRAKAKQEALVGKGEATNQPHTRTAAEQGVMGYKVRRARTVLLFKGPTAGYKQAK